MRITRSKIYLMYNLLEISNYSVILIYTLYHCSNINCKKTSPSTEHREVVSRRWRKSDTVRYILLENNRGSRYSPNEKCLFLSRSQWLLLIAAFIITSCSTLGFVIDNTAYITAASRLQILDLLQHRLLVSINISFHIHLWVCIFCRHVDILIKYIKTDSIIYLLGIKAI